MAVPEMYASTQPRRPQLHGGAIGPDRYVTQMPSQTVSSFHDRAIHDHRAPYARPESDEEGGTRTARLSPEKLSMSHRLHIVVSSYGKLPVPDGVQYRPSR